MLMFCWHLWAGFFSSGAEVQKGQGAFAENSQQSPPQKLARVGGISEGSDHLGLHVSPAPPKLKTLLEFLKPKWCISPQEKQGMGDSVR